ncbi:hypothetical protein KPH14_010162 [Odynerus spinipes]|uniref:PDZ domain-containing protein n=1 Tax=Odynerus spinipes TaxID=1348599 RepID=A0AAD9VSV3_9HYME|nr:hypothetical protein KPH14_010162 [Odynerus spinipes]
MAVNIKFTKFDNTPWGFRLAGGSDFPQPLTVIKVNEGSLAECMGLKVGDVVVRLNDEPISSLTHGQAHEALKLAGNNFVLGVQREEEARKALEAIPDENIVPYNIPLADLPPVFPEKILSEETVIEEREVTIERLPTPEEKAEELPEKPKDSNSEVIPNQNLTDEEIAQLILEEEELLDDQGVLGVNFKKLRPRATALRGSKVLEELQHIATAPPPAIEERHHVSTFLKKPDRPVPKPKPRKESAEGEPYRVVIKKQSKKSVISRLVEKGLIPPGSLDTPEPPSEVKMYAPGESNEESNEIGTAVQEDEIDFPVLPSRSIRSNDIPFEQDTLDLVSFKTSITNPISPTCLTLTRRTTFKPKRLYTRAHYFERSLFGYRKDSERITLAYLLELLLGRSPPNGTFGRIRRRGRYVETYLEREDTWLRSMLKVFSPKRNDLVKGGRRFSKPHYAERLLTSSRARVEELAERRKIPRRQKRRLCPKARYFERVLAKDVRRLIELIKEASGRVDLGKLCIASEEGIDDREKERRHGARRRSSVFKVKGHYLERCLARQDSAAIVSSLTSTFTGLVESTKRRLSDAGDGHLDITVKPRSRRCSYDRAHYGERAVVRNLEILGNLAEKVASKILGWREGRATIDDLDESLLNSTSDEDGSTISKFLRSTGEFVSAEVFHRGGRRLSRSSKVVKVNPNTESAGWLDSLARCCALDNGGARFSDDNLKPCDEKIIYEADHEGRRLSFVPTVLYKGLTNRIGVDFTRLVAYTFVPCASVVLLYMYK